jgi:hypothetical protein
MMRVNSFSILIDITTARWTFSGYGGNGFSGEANNMFIKFPAIFTGDFYAMKGTKTDYEYCFGRDFECASLFQGCVIQWGIFSKDVGREFENMFFPIAKDFYTRVITFVKSIVVAQIYSLCSNLNYIIVV